MEKEEQLFREFYYLPEDTQRHILLDFIFINDLTAKFAEFYERHKKTRGIKNERKSKI